jgi:hypothetical protein
MAASELFPQDIHPGAFDTTQFDREEFFARLTSRWQLPSEALLERRDPSRPAPTTVWYLEWENLSRPMPFNFSREVVPPAAGQSLRDSTWKRHLDAFARAGAPVRSPSDIPRLDGMIFYVERRDLVFGRGRDGEEMVARNVVLPLRIATPEEIQKLEREREEAGSGGGTEAEFRSQVRDNIISLLSEGPKPRSDLLDEVEQLLNPEREGTKTEVIVDELGRMDREGVVAFDYVNGEVGLNPKARVA